MSESGPPSEKDPFLSLLEQLAENEHLEGDGPSELDFLLGGIHAPDPNENIAPEAQGEGMMAAGGDVSESVNSESVLS